MAIIWDKVLKNNGRDIKLWERIEKRDEVERLMVQCMRCHFAQAQGTPLTSRVWRERLKNKTFLDAISEGDFSALDGEHSAVQKYFETLFEERSNEGLKTRWIKCDFDIWKKYIKKK